MCYWWRTKPDHELSDREMVFLLKELRKDGVIHVTLCGGEPTLRPSLIRVASQIFPYVWIVTNGVFARDTPSLTNVLYVVSVDGTEEMHDQIRASGVYKKIWQNFSSRPDCFISTTITKANKDNLIDLVKAWAGTKILGMTFDIATPTTDEDIYLSWEEREGVIAILRTLKEKYGGFILMSEKMLGLLRQEAVQSWSKACPIRWISVSYAANGIVKNPCVIGPQADCSRCGCHVAPFIEALRQADIDTWRLAIKLLGATRKRK